MLEDLASVMFDEEALKEKCRGLGQQIAKDYEGKDLLVVGILKGSVMFFADLTRNIGIPLHIDFMVASSYGNGTETSGLLSVLSVGYPLQHHLCAALSTRFELVENSE